MYFNYIKINSIMQLEVITMIISIVGKSGSGKSLIAEMLCSYSDKIIKLNIDEVGHYVLTLDDIKIKLLNNFGNSIMNDGLINRKRLGDLVFNNRMEMQKLTDITWNPMEKIIDNFIDNNKDKIIILDWLLLQSTKYFKASDIKILLNVPYEIRMNRAIIRDNITQEQFKIRDQASMEFCKDDFDYIIENIDINKTKRKVRDIYDKSIISR